MLTLVGSLAGFLSSILPVIFNLVKDKSDKKHEIEVIKLQIEASKANLPTRLEEVQIHAENMDNRFIYRHAKPIGISWVDALSATVRPVITYSLFLLYIGIKVIIFYDYQVGIGMPIWTDDDSTLLCAVLGFWFGSRVFSKK
jgi:hypothetical protein